MEKIIFRISILTALISSLGCGEPEKAPTEIPVNYVKVSTILDTEVNSKLYNIPSPIETFTILKMSGASFDKSLLNPAKNISKYVSNFSRAVNLGTYSSDLSFCLLYKENQDINFYLKNVNELTASLGIEGDFAQRMTQRLKANANNPDSVMQIVAEASVDAYMYLKENQRNNISILITAGGWVEGMHFITNMAHKTQKQEIFGLVASQKKVVKNLIKMLEKFETDPEISGILVDVKEISTIYDTLKPAHDDAVASTDKNVTSVGNNKSYEVTKEQLKTILEKVEALRNKIIS